MVKARPPHKSTHGGRKSGFRVRKPRPWYQRYPWLPWTLGLIVLALAVLALRSDGADDPASDTSASDPVVGADLHSLAVDPQNPETLYIGSHQGVSLSRDGGETWEVIEGLNGADAMGWAFTTDSVFVGGHPGLMVSSDDARTFELRNDGLPSTDVHALGGGEGTLYAGLAGAGTFASADQGRSWEPRSSEFGGAFMGRIQVDPSDDEHLLAPDMQAGVVESVDGGRTWKALGGVQGAMWVTWNAADTGDIIATGMEGAARTTDGGKTWERLEVPDGASLVEFSPGEPKRLYAAVLKAPEAEVYVTEDGGRTWARS